MQLEKPLISVCILFNPIMVSTCILILAASEPAACEVDFASLFPRHHKKTEEPVPERAQHAHLSNAD